MGIDFIGQLRTSLLSKLAPRNTYFSFQFPVINLSACDARDRIAAAGRERFLCSSDASELQLRPLPVTPSATGAGLT